MALCNMHLAMDTDTQAQLPMLRKLLDRRRLELQTEVRTAETARRDAAAPGAAEVSDREDDASDAIAAAIDEAEELRDIVELADVEAALRRIDAGRYGDCVACGEPIPLPRLQAQPAAARCLACQSAFERLP